MMPVATLRLNVRPQMVVPIIPRRAVISMIQIAIIAAERRT